MHYCSHIPYCRPISHIALRDPTQGPFDQRPKPRGGQLRQAICFLVAEKSNENNKLVLAVFTNAKLKLEGVAAGEAVATADESSCLLCLEANEDSHILEDLG